MLVLNGISVLMHLVWGGWLLKRLPRYTAFFGFVFFLQTWSLVSCFYNDTGIYNFELFRWTTTTLATFRLALFFIVFNAGFYAMGRWLETRPLRPVDYRVTRHSLRLGSISFGLASAVLLIMSYIGYMFYTEGIPVFQGLHKVLFLREAGLIERGLVSYCWLIGFVLGYCSRRRKFDVSKLLLIILLIYLMAVGNKFSAILRVLVPYFAAVLVVRLKDDSAFSIYKRRYLIAGSIVAAMLMMVAYASYVFWEQDIGGGAGGLLTSRILAFQGHLWWATDFQVVTEGIREAGHWKNELAALLGSSSLPEGSVGMKYVMMRAIGADAAFPIFDSGYLYTMAYPAILVHTFPYPIALVVQVFAGSLLGVCLWYLHYCIEYRHLFRGLIMMTILMPLLGTLSTGDLPVFLTAGLLFKVSLLLSLEAGLPGMFGGTANANGPLVRTSTIKAPLSSR